MLELPERPVPARSVVERITVWLRWVGVGRVIVSSVAVGAVLAGGFWLVKPPPATTESKLPFAGATTTAAAADTPGLTPSIESVPALDVTVVHVAGAVNAPGVYQVEVGSRVIDAVQAAGGMSVDADADAVNLAALVTDGQRVYVPAVGELISPNVPGADAETILEPWPINVNVAGVDRLDDLPGVGPATATAIIAHREQHGPFASVDQLADVRGIGPAKLEAIRALVTV